jgi:ATP-dependent exoDNAse (exonuclease V) beta subunit
MRERRRETALGAVGVGSAVHELLERIDLAAPAVPADLASLRPDATPEELERIEGFLAAYCSSKLAARISALDSARKEQSFSFEHDGVVLHGFIDVLVLGSHALVVDFKTNVLDGVSPEAVTDADYGLQRLVYALACFRAGAEQVEVAYQYLELPDEPVITMFAAEDVPRLEEELSAAIARIRSGAFAPTPSERACADCPALDVVCAGTRLRIAVGA